MTNSSMTQLLKKRAMTALSLTLILSLVVGCASSPRSADTREFSNETPLVSLREVDSFRVTDPEPPKVVDSELDSIPTEVNPLVEKWIAYFQGKGRKHMERYLSRSTRYSKLMKKILRENGLPEDLIYIALIESGFSHKATSRAAAVGYWQFIRGTGRRYGMEINALIDERRDPVLSTQAAAEYFKGLYSVFGSWYLAMASYNVGENRVKREVMNHYTRDFWELAKKKRFPKETINYVPKFIAAKMIGNNPEAYGFTDVEYMTPVEFEHIKVDRPVNLRLMAEKMGLEYDDLKQINPKFKGEIAPLKGNALELRVPIGQTQVALAAANQSFVDKVEYVADAGETQIYKVRSGDSLYSIARKYRTTVAWLRDVNDIQKGRKLRIGQRLAVPDKAGRKPVAMKQVARTEKREDDEQKATMSNPEVVTAQGVFYVVQPGDTLSAIADDYDSSVEELRRMNKLSKRSVLRVGLRLKVPKDEGKGLPSDPGNESGGKMKPVASSVREPSSASKQTHVVRPGENLTVIAKKYGVSIQEIRRENKLGRRSVLRVGSRLTIPSGGPQSSQPSKKAVTIAKRQKAKSKVHVVKRGENLSVIAEKYQVPVSALKDKNNINRANKLFVGTRLMIPIASARD